MNNRINSIMFHKKHGSDVELAGSRCDMGGDCNRVHQKTKENNMKEINS